MNNSILCDNSTQLINEQTKSLPSGVWPVVLTPFLEDGQIDWQGYEKLLDWYATHDCAGLFAVCLSSELYFLSPEEQLELARRARCQVDIPVVAAGYLGNHKTEKIDSIKRMADTGVDTVIVPVCQLAPEDADDAALLFEIEDVINQTGDISLGLYECPDPYHRLISPEVLGKCAEAGRFKFLKDTCCDTEIMEQKITACDGTPLKIYNAYIHNLFDTLKLGGAGFNGLAASFFPELLTKLVQCYDSDPKKASELQILISVGQSVIGNKYPSCAKYFLKLRGVDIGTYCRNGCLELTEPDIETLKAFKKLLDTWNHDN
jgi:4-hydroxy-tetrahydrodipicolinate synthase